MALQAARHLTSAASGRRARTTSGAPYITTDPGLQVEVLAGTTRHAVVTVSVR